MKKNNQGFSLVELLVSIVILAIIMIPILDNIVVSTRMNMKSKEVADVTGIASNIMESVKAEGNLSEIAKDLMSADSSTFLGLFTGEDASEVTVTEVEKQEEKYVPATTSCLKKEDDGTYTWKENANRKYQFAVEHLKYQNETYNAMITFDAAAYAETEDSINNQEIPVIENVSTDHNAVITCSYSDDWAESSLKHLYNQWFNENYTGKNEITNERISQNMKRSFEITVNKNDRNNKYEVTAKAVYKLTDELIPGIPAENEAYKTYENTLFEKDFDSLDNVYLFYTPKLDTKAGERGDEVTFVNNLPQKDAAISFYLVEQKQSIANYETLMGSYILYFNLQEANPITQASGAKTYQTVFHTNLGDTVTTTKPVITTNIGSLDQFVQKGITDVKQDKTRLYEVTVELYKAQDGATIGQRFDEKNRLASISSTKGVSQ